MITIKRSCSYRIITRAVNAEGQPLVGLLAPGADDCEPCLDAGQLQAALQTRADTVIVYNQHADALALVDTLSVPEDQVFIEIRQDTKGVLGLHAVRRSNPDNETLELTYQ
ncbi:MAG TPA: hypothetical protein VMZ32_11810 [Gammaproteobacteria bacterium]|nr:hypothetical protein [Gammaproteobacteria bacterium]